MKYKFILLALLFLFITACSSDDDSNPTSSNTDSFITGNWSVDRFTLGGGVQDSMTARLNLTGKDGVFTGTGTIIFGGSSGTNNFYGIFENDIKGVYSTTSISLTAKNNITNDTYNFLGNIVSSTAEPSYTGISTMIIGGNTYTYETTIFKNSTR